MAETRPIWMRSSKGTPLTGIGSLEADILAIVWEKERATVRDVFEALLKRRQIAYTTVMTVMNNLVKKHLLAQDKTNIAYLYTPAIPGAEVAQTILDSVVNRLLGGHANSALSHLLGLRTTLTAEQTAALKRYAEEHLQGGKPVAA
jgi:BlaI family penicillinase repressor